MLSEYQTSSSSPKDYKPMKSTRCGGLSSCFSAGGGVHHEVLAVAQQNDAVGRIRTPRSPPSWRRSTAHDLPEIRERCRNLIARFGRSRCRYHHSSDFSYDLSSYALNFEDDTSRDDDDESSRRHFSSRLPASPPQMAKFVSDSAAIRRGLLIVGFS